MRLLVIGYALPDSAIDNYNVFSAPSYTDYDAVFVDPSSITAAVAQLLDDGRDFEAFDGRPVVNAATTASAVAAADQLRRRTDETARFLEAGGLVLVAARPNATRAGVVGFEGCDRYSWLPAPPGMSWGPPYLKPAEGRTIRVVADGHPLARLLRDQRPQLAYRAVFDDRQQAFRQHGKVIATGGAGLPIAAEFAVLGGRVVFVPAFPDEVGPLRSDIAAALATAARGMLGTRSPEPAPSWARSLGLPGLEQVEAELEEADAAATAAESQAHAVRERHDALAAHRRLVWEEGPGFVDAVAGALRLLGFVVERGEGDALTLEGEGVRALVACEGSRETVVEWPYVRLQRRLEQHLLATGEALKGAVVVNGQRAKAPEDRDQPFTTPLRIACENYRYALLSGETLFALVQRGLGGATEAELTGVRRRLLAASGLLETAAALGEVEEGRDAGPIF